MKRALIVVAAVAMALATLAPVAGASPQSFRGDWSAVDLSDGSNLSLSISPRRLLPDGQTTSGPVRLSLVSIADDSSPFCGGCGISGTGTGDPTGVQMTVTFTLRCDGAASSFGTATVTFFSSQGTLTDSVHAGSVWYRS